MASNYEFLVQGETLKLPSKIDISNAGDLKDTLISMYEKKQNNIVIDFANVESIDSSGLGKLLLFQSKLKERGGSIRIINVNSDYIKKLFEIIQLYKVIDIQE